MPKSLRDMLSRSRSDAPDKNALETRETHMKNTQRSAFTIVELLVVISIITILLGLLASGIGGAITGGKRTKELNRLKGVMTAWTMYSGQYEDQLLPGYLETGVQSAWGVRYKNRQGTELAPELCQTYTWRLLPFLDYNYEPILGYRESDEDTLDESIYFPSAIPVTLPTQLASAESMAGAGASLQPAFGYNAFYCGGWWKSVAGSPNLTFGDGTFTQSAATVRGRLVARTIGGISKPSDFVVFTASTFLNAGTYGPFDDFQPGAAWTVPNRLAATPVWGFGGVTLEGVDVAALAPLPNPNPNSDAGKLVVATDQSIPFARYGGTVSVGMGDGSVKSSSMAELSDIRLWIPCANAPDFTHTP